MSDNRPFASMLSRSLIMIGLSLMTLISASTSTGASRNPATVHVLIVVPSQYGGPATATTAETVLRLWLGQPTDSPCTGDFRVTGCTIEGWFRQEIGEVFDYDVTIVNLAETATDLDYAAVVTLGCGEIFNSLDNNNNMRAFVSAESGYVGTGQRTMYEVLGAGGYARHKFISSKSTTTGYGIIGDWGVAEQLGIQESCDLFAGNYAVTGFGHEFAGMMGTYSTSQTDTDDNVYAGTQLTAAEKHNLTHNSGDWLRSP